MCILKIELPIPAIYIYNDVKGYDDDDDDYYYY